MGGGRAGHGCGNLSRAAGEREHQRVRERAGGVAEKARDYSVRVGVAADLGENFRVRSVAQLLVAG